jgi:hypothetical protein
VQRYLRQLKSEGPPVSLARKLNLPSGTKLRVVGKPKAVDLGDVDATSSSRVLAVLVFVTKLADVDAACAPVIEAAREDRIAWAAYLKAGQLGTDLNRDVLWKHLLHKHRVQGIRQIALDEVWSAMRFRPAK